MKPLGQLYLQQHNHHKSGLRGFNLWDPKLHGDKFSFTLSPPGASCFRAPVSKGDMSWASEASRRNTTVLPTVCNGQVSSCLSDLDLNWTSGRSCCTFCIFQTTLLLAPLLRPAPCLTVRAHSSHLAVTCPRIFTNLSVSLFHPRAQMNTYFFELVRLSGPYDLFMSMT